MPPRARTDADQVFAYIKQHIETYGCIPKNVEIAHHFGFKSDAMARYYLRMLIKRGLIVPQEHYRVITDPQ